MASLAGKYQHEKNENLVALMKLQGVSDENSQKADAAHPILEISVDGNKYTTKGGLLNRTTVYTLNEEIEESLPEQKIHYKSIAKLNGSNLVITSTFSGHTTTSEYKATANGLEVATSASKDPSIVAKIYFKRI